MGKRVNLQGHAIVQKALQLRKGWIKRVAHDADVCPAINFFEPRHDWTKKILVTLRRLHVINSQNDHALDSRFTAPLGCDQLRKLQVWVKGIRFLQISEPVG